MKFITACLLAMFISGIVAYANVTPSPEVPYTLKQLNIVDENTFSNNNTVSRGECLTTIMRSIGLKDEYLMSLNGADFYAFVDTESYSYYGCAYRAQIAYGEECIVKHPTYRSSHTGKNTDFFFFPERPATIKEALAFMVRCLSSDNSNYENTTIEALKFNLIYPEDSFINELDSNISQETLYLLLERFLSQKRYKYYKNEYCTNKNDYFRMEGWIDEKQNITYWEHLRQTKGDVPFSSTFH